MSYSGRSIGGVPPGKPDPEIRELMKEGGSSYRVIERSIQPPISQREKRIAGAGGPPSLDGIRSRR